MQDKALLLDVIGLEMIYIAEGDPCWAGDNSRCLWLGMS